MCQASVWAEVVLLWGAIAKGRAHPRIGAHEGTCRAQWPYSHPDT